MGPVIWMAVIGILYFFASWYVGIPVPPGYANPYKLRCLFVVITLFKLYVYADTIEGGIVHIHGGGWCVGTPVRDTLKTPAMTIKNDLLENWVLRDMDVKAVLNVSLGNGDSAGGNLAAATCLRLRDAELRPQPKLQVLIYPCLQATDFLSPSFQANTHDVILSKEQMATFWIMYALGDCKHLEEVMRNAHLPPELKRKVSSGKLQHEDIIQGYSCKGYIKPGLNSVGNGSIWKEFESTFMDPYFAPLMAEDVNNLPDTIVLTVEQDVLRDDGIWYVKQLKKAGNNVTHMHYLAGFHGILSLFEDSVNYNQLKDLVVNGIKSKL